MVETCRYDAESSVFETIPFVHTSLKINADTDNPPKPRFFERARPNQMWQSDIMTFRLAGRNAYLIGFMDDYSRYIIALGLHRSQTAEHVLETYRRAVAEYGVPKEMLTDNGRQYTNWRGKTRFEREMQKDRVKHIRSRPHHPMTLGKIERFWKSILGEFLQRAQFDSFEQAVERCAFWIKYYNHKRPHQGIGGLCPADRFFEIAHDLKKTLQRGVEENVLELPSEGGQRTRSIWLAAWVASRWSSALKRARSKCWWTMPTRKKNLRTTQERILTMKTSQRTRRVFDPQQKITAVLSIWSDRRTSAQVCQELDISPTLLGQWQNLAIEGMLKALDPKQKDPLPPINQRLSRLIEKKLAGPNERLEKRLKTIQKATPSA